MIYISLTITLDGLNNWNLFIENLNSLLNQKTDKEYYVILSIPTIYEIPIKLLEFANITPKLIINHDIPDYGEITKMFGMLKYSTDPNDILVVCNSNYIYHEDMLEYHIKKLNEYSDHAICFGGESGTDKRMWIEGNEIRYVFRNTSLLIPTDCDRYLLIPSHAYSVSYKRSYFKDDFNEEILNLTDNDDLIMGYYLKKHQIWLLCVKWNKETDFRPRLNNFFPVLKKTLNVSKEYRYNREKMNKIINKMLYYDMEEPEGKRSIYYVEKNNL